MADHMKAPLLFPCANRVKMPHVGADETRFKIKDQKSVAPSQLQPIYTTMPAKGLPKGVKKSYVKQISNGFSFSEDVVKDRSFHTLPYSDKYFHAALDASDLIIPPARQRILVGRHDARGPDRRHMPCLIQPPTTGAQKHKLRPLKATKAEEGPAESSPSSFFLTETNLSTFRSLKSDKDTLTSRSYRSDRSADRVPKPEQQSAWDEYLLSIVSRRTAEWIVRQRTSPGPAQRKLEAFVESQYGPIEEQEPELVRDNVSEVDLSAGGDEEEEKRWKKGDDTMLDKVRALTLARQLPTDPYADDNNAAFYRLPAGVRRAKKHHDKEEAGAINTTAYAIELVPFTAPPPPTLRDHMNPRVGDKILNTDNKFVQERLTGAKQVFTGPEDKHKIVLDTDNKYRKVYVEECPLDPDSWYLENNGGTPRGPGDNTKLYKGLHRWKTLPEPIDDTAEKFHVQPPGGDGVTDGDDSVAATTKTYNKSNSMLIRMIDDWRQKWHLDMRYADASPDDLIRDMADIHPHIRLKAITTCARAAEYRPPPPPGIQLDSPATQLDPVQLLPEQLFTALQLCLDDDNERVRRAAAIALYTLERPGDQAESVLRTALSDDNAIDRWTAAQCLAYYGECDSEVVGELITQLLGTEDAVRHEQAAGLLARLSENSTLVHSMIAEQLNSSSWRHRIMACRVLPKLQGHINKDLVNKLVHLMWSDWHGEVRRTAAQTLGRTGHGRRVHDTLREKITGGDERERVEAVSRVGQLGIMTAKLLPAFLQCFSDNYVSVREEVCIACGNLAVDDRDILTRLVDAVTYDPIWKVKALAIQALGRIGRVTPPVRDCVLWAFRYEDRPGVRVEACHTIISLGLREPEVAQILQDRYLVEKSELVKTEITAALEMFAISPSADMDMVTQIKEEVRKLCTRDNICTQITLNDADDTREHDVQSMIYQPPDSPQKEPQTPRYRPINRQLTRIQSSDSLPHPPESPRPSSRPYSQETTAAADREIMAILDRYDDDEALSQYTDPDMLIVSKPQKESLARSPTDLMSLPKSRVTFAADYQPTEAGESGDVQEVKHEQTDDDRVAEKHQATEDQNRDVDSQNLDVKDQNLDVQDQILDVQDQILDVQDQNHDDQYISLGTSGQSADARKSEANTSPKSDDVAIAAGDNTDDLNTDVVATVEKDGSSLSSVSTVPTLEDGSNSDEAVPKSPEEATTENRCSANPDDISTPNDDRNAGQISTSQQNEDVKKPEERINNASETPKSVELVNESPTNEKQDEPDVIHKVNTVESDSLVANHLTTDDKSEQ